MKFGVWKTCRKKSDYARRLNQLAWRIFFKVTPALSSYKHDTLILNGPGLISIYSVQKTPSVRETWSRKTERKGYYKSPTTSRVLWGKLSLSLLSKYVLCNSLMIFHDIVEILILVWVKLRTRQVSDNLDALSLEDQLVRQGVISQEAPLRLQKEKLTVSSRMERWSSVPLVSLCFPNLPFLGFLNFYNFILQPRSWRLGLYFEN